MNNISLTTATFLNIITLRLDIHKLWQSPTSMQHKLAKKATSCKQIPREMLLNCSAQLIHDQAANPSQISFQSREWTTKATLSMNIINAVTMSKPLLKFVPLRPRTALNNVKLTFPQWLQHERNRNAFGNTAEVPLINRHFWEVLIKRRKRRIPRFQQLKTKNVRIQNWRHISIL